jgi:hypothetical protein
MRLEVEGEIADYEQSEYARDLEITPVSAREDLANDGRREHREKCKVNQHRGESADRI